MIAVSQAECRRFEPVHPLSSKPCRLPHLRDTPDQLRAATFTPRVKPGVKRGDTEAVAMPDKPKTRPAVFTRLQPRV